MGREEIAESQDNHCFYDSLTEAGFYSLFIPPAQWFSNIRVQLDQLKGLFKPIAESHPQSFSFSKSGVEFGFAYLVSSHLRMMVLVWEPHFEKHCLTT